MRITARTVHQICQLSETLAPVQRRMVADNALSIAEAHFSEQAWLRAIYADETPVGFIMTHTGSDYDDGIDCPGVFLWRLIIAVLPEVKGMARWRWKNSSGTCRQPACRCSTPVAARVRAAPKAFTATWGSRPLANSTAMRLSWCWGWGALLSDSPDDVLNTGLLSHELAARAILELDRQMAHSSQPD
jgi:hypothetical protein